MDAFAALAPVSEAYAHLPVAEAFDWRRVGRQLGAGEWYLVAFRSDPPPDADEARLTAFDDRAHHEAQSSPGFVHYFKGPAAADGRASRSASGRAGPKLARRPGGRPTSEAVSVIDEMYERYTLEFLRVYGPGRLAAARSSPTTRCPADPRPMPLPVFGLPPLTGAPSAS